MLIDRDHFVMNISTLPLCSCRLSHCSRSMEGILKRKFADVDDNPRYSSSPPSSLSSPGSSEWESDGEGSLFDNQDFTPHSPSPATTVPSKSLHLSNNANLFF